MPIALKPAIIEKGHISFSNCLPFFCICKHDKASTESGIFRVFHVKFYCWNFLSPSLKWVDCKMQIASKPPHFNSQQRPMLFFNFFRIFHAGPITNSWSCERSKLPGSKILPDVETALNDSRIRTVIILQLFFKISRIDR